MYLESRNKISVVCAGQYVIVTIVVIILVSLRLTAVGHFLYYIFFFIYLDFSLIFFSNLGFVVKCSAFVNTNCLDTCCKINNFFLFPGVTLHESSRQPNVLLHAIFSYISILYLVSHCILLWLNYKNEKPSNGINKLKFPPIYDWNLAGFV